MLTLLVSEFRSGDKLFGNFSVSVSNNSVVEDSSVKLRYDQIRLLVITEQIWMSKDTHLWNKHAKPFLGRAITVLNWMDPDSRSQQTTATEGELVFRRGESVEAGLPVTSNDG